MKLGITFTELTDDCGEKFIKLSSKALRGDFVLKHETVLAFYKALCFLLENFDELEDFCWAMQELEVSLGMDMEHFWVHTTDYDGFESGISLEGKEQFRLLHAAMKKVFNL